MRHIANAVRTYLAIFQLGAAHGAAVDRYECVVCHGTFYRARAAVGIPRCLTCSRAAAYSRRVHGR